MIVVLLSGCEWKEATVDDIFIKFEVSSKTVLADGSSIVTISAYINEDTELDKRTVNFITTNGVFVDGKDSKISKTAVFENDLLVARVSLKAPTSPDTIMVTAEMAYSEIRKDYIKVSEKIIVSPSIPKDIKLSSESFSVYTNYDGSIVITGKLINQAGNSVSKGEEVEFSDVFSSNTTMGVNGRFKSSNLQKSDDNSQVSITYSPGPVNDKTDILIMAKLVKYPTIKDEILINAREKK